MFRKKQTPQMPPEWLIVGLGNPGGEYRGTRHNVGFDVVELLAKRCGEKLGRGRIQALVGQVILGRVSALLVKPLTYMNLSGQSVGPLAKSNGIKPDHVLVIADDLDLPLAKIRFRASGSAGGHNGHKSIIQALGTQDYPRFKIGIGRGEESIGHVLGPFDQNEKPVIESAVEKTAKAVELLLNDGEQAMLHFLEAN